MTKNTLPFDILQMPYSERQLIVVQPDEVVKATRQAEAATIVNNGQPDWKEIALQVGKVAFRFTILRPITDITFDALSAWAKAREGGLNVLQVARSEASRLKFPPGHPREQALYVAHPALPSVYYTTASFHRMAFEHKFAEAIYLLMSLGATQITVEHVRGWSREFSARLATPLPESDVKLEASKSSTGSSSLLFEATLNNKQTPAIPSALVWYEHEPTWQEIAKGRIQFGLSQFSLTVNYDDDFGVNAGLKLRVQKAGLDLGGTFEDHLATTWKIHGKFGNDG
jgi:hypothetical protein